VTISTNPTETYLPSLKATLTPLLSSVNELFALDLRPDIFSTLCEQLAPKVHHQEVSIDELRRWARGRLPESSFNELMSSAAGSTAILVCGLRVDSLDPLDLAKLVQSGLSLGRPIFVVLDIGTLPRQEVEPRLACLLDVFERSGVHASTSQLAHLNKKLYYAVIGLGVADHPKRWMLGNLAETHFTEFYELFAEAFGQEYDQRLWNWKYANGRGRAVLARKAGRLVAYYGSTERRLRFFGEAGAGLQICDVMVAPKERGVLTKKGVMFQTAAAYQEAYLGVQRQTLGYGFPTKRHILLGERLGLYAEVAKMTELRWTGLKLSSEQSSVRVRSANLSENSTWITDAWKQMARSLKGNICVERDLQYMLYRYVQHPTRDYQLYLVSTRLTRRLIGGIVLQTCDDAVELVDVIGPRKQFNRLAAAAKLVAAATPSRTLYCWITDTFVEEFADDNCVSTDLGLSVPTNVWVQGPDPQRLRGKWFLMSGDTEFR